MVYNIDISYFLGLLYMMMSTEFTIGKWGIDLLLSVIYENRK